MCISNYNPDVIARNVKQLGNGVIEVRRYNDGHIRNRSLLGVVFMYDRLYAL